MLAELTRISAELRHKTAKKTPEKYGIFVTRLNKSMNTMNKHFRLPEPFGLLLVEGTGIGARLDQYNNKSISEGWDG